MLLTISIQPASPPQILDSTVEAYKIHCGVHLSSIDVLLAACPNLQHLEMTNDVILDSWKPTRSGTHTRVRTVELFGQGTGAFGTETERPFDADRVFDFLTAFPRLRRLRVQCQATTQLFDMEQFIVRLEQQPSLQCLEEVIFITTRSHGSEHEQFRALLPRMAAVLLSLNWLLSTHWVWLFDRDATGKPAMTVRSRPFNLNPPAIFGVQQC